MTDPTLVPVAVACPCPGTPHDGDTVYLAPKLGLHGGVWAQTIMVQSPQVGIAKTYADLAECYLLEGIKAWTLVDVRGDDLDVNEQTIRDFFSEFDRAQVVADAADDLYTRAVLDPLLAQASKFLRRTRTNGSTSPRRRLSEKRRKPSKPSSTTTSETVATETTSD